MTTKNKINNIDARRKCIRNNNYYHMISAILVVDLKRGFF